MPKWAARIWLEVTSVRVERLQAITEEGAKAEGTTPYERDHDDDCGNGWTTYHYRRQFPDLWDGLAKDGTRWADNPWVWVVEFVRVEGGAV